MSTAFLADCDTTWFGPKRIFAHSENNTRIPTAERCERGYTAWLTHGYERDYEALYEQKRVMTEGPILFSYVALAQRQENEN